MDGKHLPHFTDETLCPAQCRRCGDLSAVGAVRSRTIARFIAYYDKQRHDAE